MSNTTYEVLAPVRIHRKSRAVGERVVAPPEHVADLVASGVLRAVEAADDDQSARAVALAEASANSGTALDAAKSGASAGNQGSAQGGADATGPVTDDTKAPDTPPVDKATTPAAQSGASKPAAKRGSASKARE
ncbi:Uncharacterised protein [Burkholderia pseudomallei]|uniref:hypothetical protein n=1 Tax=Burkholderia pseudomallei TaxID=28450 RepID=UPI000975AD24|nr:hypothetical protein [Burkholderia pseudomallei]MBO3058393.1 hypothetical protein [Burkholderia pseudomallei]MBO7793693.1 hypothetical protein [Burkholderia pseudomallei]MBO7882414.1 hypothetical protein [Burkholderia pseudomallei]MPT66080.1 hypothetical protein [Burkholderia pseudomallei]MPT72757.1 hypothetical protein [Burkholderia pseudomallei]